ncbi:MAG: hypothetical protein WCD38_02645 [Candidatus Tumulicola sp.]
MVAVKAPFSTGLLRWIAAGAIALPFFAASLWIVVTSIPYPKDPGIPTFSIVASAVLVSALAIEELIGPDLRRFLGNR